jgi:hypothetical protein
MPKIFVEAWDPEYGSPFVPGDMTPSLAEVDPSVEVPAGSWKPIPPDPAAGAAERLAFIDGVRRIDALVWIDDGDTLRRGLCASYAAGVVRSGPGGDSDPGSAPTAHGRRERRAARDRGRDLYSGAGGG